MFLFILELFFLTIVMAAVLALLAYSCYRLVIRANGESDARFKRYAIPANLVSACFLTTLAATAFSKGEPVNGTMVMALAVFMAGCFTYGMWRARNQLRLWHLPAAMLVVAGLELPIHLFGTDSLPFLPWIFGSAAMILYAHAIMKSSNPKLQNKRPSPPPET